MPAGNVTVVPGSTTTHLGEYEKSAAVVPVIVMPEAGSGAAVANVQPAISGSTALRLPPLPALPADDEPPVPAAEVPPDEVPPDEVPAAAVPPAEVPAAAVPPAEVPAALVPPLEEPSFSAGALSLSLPHATPAIAPTQTTEPRNKEKKVDFIETVLAFQQGPVNALVHARLS